MVTFPIAPPSIFDALPPACSPVSSKRRAFFLDYDGTLTSHRGSSSQGILTMEPSRDVLAVLKVIGEGTGTSKGTVGDRDQQRDPRGQGPARGL